jgi:hypothetical protein
MSDRAPFAPHTVFGAGLDSRAFAPLTTRAGIENVFVTFAGECSISEIERRPLRCEPVA